MLRKFLAKLFKPSDLKKIDLWPGEYDKFMYLDIYKRSGSYSIPFYPVRLNHVKKIPDELL